MFKINIMKSLYLVVISCLLLLILNDNVNAGYEQNKDLKGKICEIINYGALAPSTHNAQMWKVKIIVEDKIRVLLDKEHILSQVDPQNRESLISLGTFIENMVEVAPYYQLKADVHILAKAPSDEEVAELSFYPQNDTNFDKKCVENIKNRHTIRTPFLRKELSESDLAFFRTLGLQYHYFPLSSKEGQYLKEAIVQATRQQVSSDQKQQELAQLFRFSKKEADAQKDGLTPEGMGLSGIVKWYVTHFFTQNTVLSKSFRKQTVATTQKQVENCSGFVMLTSEDNSVTAWINSGRLLERFLLMATARKIAVQPMSAPLEEDPWKKELSQKIGLGSEAQMILRVGYVKDFGHQVSQRREVVILPE